MPYQTVQYPATGVPAATELTVHWNKAGDDGTPGHVQIQAERHVWVSRPEDVNSNGHAKVGCVCQSSNESCGAVPAKLGSSESGESIDFEGLPKPAQIVTDVLTRDQINALIRTLRRARDNAYGSDA